MSSRNQDKSWSSRLKNLFLVSVFAFVGFASVSAQAEIRVLAAGGGLLGAPYATEEIISNGDVVGTVDRPSWSDFRLLTTADIIANYDVFVIPWNTDPVQYDFDWTTRVAPMLASGMGVIWEAPMTTGYAGSPLFTMLGNRYTCNGGAVCWIPDTPLNVLSVPSITDGITGDFGSSTGYFTSWDSALTPFVEVDATDLGTVAMGLYGQYGAGRIIITHNEQDTIGASTGTAAQVNAYNLMINKLEWVAASTVQPDPNLRAVPDADGLAEADAITAFNNAGFVISNTFYTTTNIDASGHVVSQDPQAGTVGFVGDPVTLFVVAPQTGSPVTVPDVTGVTTANAEAALLGVGLERGQLTWGYSPTVPAGDVIAQNPAAGSTDITTGWIVDLVESNGNLAGRVPYLKFLTQTEAGSAITASGYVVGDVATASHNVIPSGSIIDQIPWAGATLAGGESVSLIVSTGPAGAANISTPDVAGLTQAAAESSITGAGLIVGTVSIASSETVPAGDVISQSPVAGTLLASGAAVNLLVSSGSASISIPDVVNLPQATAESTLSSAGLTIGVISNAWSDAVAAGAVISQDPASGTTVGIGSIVNLLVSDGAEPGLTIVPDVKQRTEAEAVASLSALLTVGEITYEASPAYPVYAAGDVIRTSPSGGALVYIGTVVDIVVSTGPAAILTPDLLGLPQAVAEADIVDAGLVVGSITLFPSDTVPAGNVISQDPLVGYPVAEGATVYLTISSGPVAVEILVPSVVGLSQASAEAEIAAASLTVGAVLTANSETVAAGDVISQNPVAGSNVSEGSTVDLVVSLGAVAPPPPAGPVEVFSDSFENGAWNGLWTEGSQGDWFTNSQRATSGGRSAEVDGFASNAQLISIPIDLQGGTQASITFNWYIESGLDSGEYLAFDVSTDGGSSWTEQATLRGNVDAENTWHSVQVDLNGISSLQLRFRANMSSSREDANVDDVSVVVQAGGTPPPVTVVPPVADAGADQTVTEGDTVNLNGSASSDADGTIVSYEWSAPAGVSLSDTTSATPSFTAPAGPTTLTFTLTVTDNDGQSDSNSVTITVDAVAPPPPPPPAGEPVDVFSDSFENGAWNGLWSEDSQGDWFTNSQRSTSGSNSAEVDGSASDAQLISTPIDLQGGSQVSISFNWYIESGLDSGEYLAFDVSTDGGASWTQQATLQGNVDAENTWHSVQVDLNGIPSLQLRFRARMSSSREDANIDEVKVTVQ